MFKEMGMNVMWCVAFLLAVGAANYPPMAGGGGVDSCRRPRRKALIRIPNSCSMPTAQTRGRLSRIAPPALRR